MSITLSGSRNMFGCLQNTLSKGSKTRIDLSKGVHQTLDNFRWITKDLASRSIHLVKLTPFVLMAEWYHCAPGKCAERIWFHGDKLQPQDGYQADVPVLWRLKWSKLITLAAQPTITPKGQSRTWTLNWRGVSFTQKPPHRRLVNASVPP